MSTHNQPDLIEITGSKEQLKAMKPFYTDAFGWEFTDYGDEYSDTHDSGIVFGINASENNKQSMPLTVLYSDNLEETKDKVIQAGGKILVDIYSFPGGRRFHFTDPANNELAVWGK